MKVVSIKIGFESAIIKVHFHLDDVTLLWKWMLLKPVGCLDNAPECVFKSTWSAHYRKACVVGGDGTQGRRNAESAPNERGVKTFMLVRTSPIENIGGQIILTENGSSE
jgi:hypothetical protein